MLSVAYAVVAVATLAAAYVARLLVLGVGWADYRMRPSGSTARDLAFCAVAGGLLVALPLVGGGGLAWRGHPGWALLVALGSLLPSGVGFVILASASRP